MDERVDPSAEDLDAMFGGQSRYAAKLITEDSAAQSFAERYSDELVFCHTRQKWFMLHDGRWHPDETGTVNDLCRKHVRKLVADEEDRVVIAAGKASFLKAVERMCRDDPTFSRDIARFDRAHLLLGVPNGVVDLRSGEFRTATAQELITKSTAINPDFEASHPTWSRFLTEVSAGNKLVTDFIRLWCGYCLTGSTKEHALLFIFGPGGNGKSVFVNVLTRILGSYAVKAPMSVFTAGGLDRHPTELAMMAGARLVVASETEEGHALAEARIKELTGGDSISARFMRQDFFTYSPTFKLTLVGNHQPPLKNPDEAMRRRINMLGFLFKPQQPDRDLEAKLEAEFPAILAWMIGGCIEWQQTGLVRPPVMHAATAAYFAEQDVFGRWLEEMCYVDKGNHSVRATMAELRGSFNAYCREEGIDAWNDKRLASALVEAGFVMHRTNVARYRVGIRMRRSD